MLGIEDEVVVSMALNYLEDKVPSPRPSLSLSPSPSPSQSQDKSLDPKDLQINLTGFLGGNAKIFVTELWQLLLSAAESPGGIPADLLKQYEDVGDGDGCDGVVESDVRHGDGNGDSVVDDIQRRRAAAAAAALPPVEGRTSNNAPQVCSSITSTITIAITIAIPITIPITTMQSIYVT